MSTVVEPIIQEVVANLDEAATITRSFNGTTIGSFTFGIGTGIVVGFLWGYHYNKKKLYSEAMLQAEEEIKVATSEMAEHYRNKELALADRVKDPIDEIIKEKGYSIKDNEEVLERPIRETKRPLPAPVPLVTDRTDTHVWDYTKENSNRNPRLPYVIHKDEYELFTAYEDVTYTWYSLDEVLTDEDNNRIENLSEIIGAETLERFGHGSGDPNVVFVRNNELRLQIEVVQVPNQSYEEMMEGLDSESFGIVDDESS